MSKTQQIAQQRLADVRSKWRTDTGDAELVEAYLQLGRKVGGGYTDDAAGKLARIFDLNGRLSPAQVANVRRAALESMRQPAPEPVQKRKYTRRKNVQNCVTVNTSQLKRGTSCKSKKTLK